MAFSKRMTLIFLQEIMAVDSQDPEIIASLDRDVPRRRRHQWVILNEIIPSGYD